MPHVLHRATLALHTPLGTPLAGDTLFGQLCWALREAAGEAELRRRLQGYTEGSPWLVVSDGFPAGYLPRPTLPQHFSPTVDDPAQRKAAKRQRWLAAARSGERLAIQLANAVADRKSVDRSSVRFGSARSRSESTPTVTPATEKLAEAEPSSCTLTARRMPEVSVVVEIRGVSVAFTSEVALVRRLTL